MNKKAMYAFFLVMSLVFVGGCGGGGGSGASIGTGTVSLDIADAKPFLDGAQQPDEVWIVFDAVRVHTSGGGWVSLKMPETPFEINLLAFYDGRTTEFATPTRIPAGQITQIRFEISRAYMVFYGPPEITEKIDLDVPSGTLRTDKQIDWTLTNGGAMSLTVHFDLSQSIVLAGATYKLKPVLHLFNNEPQEAARICGKIVPSSFGGVYDPPRIDISAIFIGSDGSEAPYTDVTVLKESDTDPTEFCIYWLVPLETDETYSILFDNDNDGEADHEELVEELESGVTDYYLNNGDAISIPSDF